MDRSIALLFQSHEIHVREAPGRGSGSPSGDQVNLTDMWRAAGSDRSRRPVMWLALEQTRALVEALEKVVQGDLLVNPEKGRGGATWADRRLAIAYGEYLSSDFHAWCLTVLDQFCTERAQNRGAWGEWPALARLILRPRGELADPGRMFEPQHVIAINRVYGLALDWRGGIQPKYLGAVYHNLIYPTIIGSRAYREIKARKERARHWRSMSDPGLEAFRECLNEVITVARLSRDREDFRSKLDVHFSGGMLQLILIHDVA